MASEGLNKPEWLPDTSTESESERGSVFDPNERIGDPNHPEWLLPPEQAAYRLEPRISETTALRSQQTKSSEPTSSTKSKHKRSATSSSGGSVGSGRSNNSKGGGGGSSRRRVRGGGGSETLRLLRYKAERPCCLSLFNILHLTAMLAGALAAISQILDLVVLAQNNRVLAPHLTLSECWKLAQAVALRGYGVVFAVVVVVTELSEFDLGVWGKKLLGSCHANPVAQQWWVRGLAYVFVGLFALESSREYVVYGAAGADSTGGASSSSSSSGTPATNANGTSSSTGSGMLDSIAALSVVQYAGTLLMGAGFLYFLLGICWCKALKDLQVKEMALAKRDLVEYLAANNIGGAKNNRGATGGGDVSKGGSSSSSCRKRGGGTGGGGSRSGRSGRSGGGSDNGSVEDSSPSSGPTPGGGSTGGMGSLPSWLPGWSSLTGNNSLPPSSSRNRDASPPAYARRQTPSKHSSSAHKNYDDDDGWPLARTEYSHTTSSSGGGGGGGARARRGGGREGEDDEDEESGHASSREQFLGSLYTTARSPKGPVYSGGGGGGMPPYAPLPSNASSAIGGEGYNDDDERGSGDSWHQ